MNPKTSRGPGAKVRGAALALSLTAAMSLAGPVAAGAAFGPASPVPPANIADGRILVAQNQQNTAELLVRIQDLEGQIRTMTGQIEGLQFQLTQMQTLLERMTEDNEFRFQQLDLPAQRRLGDVDAFRGAAEMLVLGHGDEISNLSQIHED